MPVPVQLTDRDARLLEMVFAYRGVTVGLLRRRFFPTPGARSACYARVQRLVAGQYLVASRLPSASGVGSGKALLTLGPRGRRVVAALSGHTRTELGRASRLVAPLVVAHHLAIGDVRLSLELAAERSPVLSLVAWTPEIELARTPLSITDPIDGTTVRWVPDGALTLALPDGRRQQFLLELDRGTIPGTRLRVRLRGYLLLADVRPRPVLFVVPDAARETAIRGWVEAEAARLGADPTVVWLTTLGRVGERTVLDAPIWQVAGHAGHAGQPQRLALVELAGPRADPDGQLAGTDGARGAGGTGRGGRP